MGPAAPKTSSTAYSPLSEMNREKSISLHSRYNPEGEAERYIASLSLNGNIRFFILIEPGMGYIIGPLKKRFPGAKVISLHASAEHYSERGSTPDAEWYADSCLTVQDFLEREIPDTEAAEIRLLEWRPALALYGSAYLTLVEEAARFIKRSDANARTIKNFGRRWFRNYFRNLEIIKTVIEPLSLSLPLLVTGAGPGLEDVIPLVREESRQGSIFVLAVSSSVNALEAGGVSPGMVISTDGGLWAPFHLYDWLRSETTRAGAPGTASCALAASLTAALPSQCGNVPILPISDGSLWQSLTLRGLGIPFIALPQRGTVSASALDLAFVLTKGDIYLAGMDLANRDIRSHARPYGLDRFIEDKAGRFSPAYSGAYGRSSMLKAGGSFGIYASWFAKQLAAYPKRLHSLGKNNPLFRSLETQSLRTEREAAAAGLVSGITLRNSESLSQKALDILERAMVSPAWSAKLREEFLPLLSPNGREEPPGELLETLRSLAGSYKHG